MNVVLLTGNPQEDRTLFSQHWQKPETVFALRSEKTALYEYIDKMITSGRAQLKVRICKELTGLDVDYCEMENADADSVQTIRPEDSRHATTLSELLAFVNPAKSSYVTVNGDIDADEETRKAVRTQLGEIVQQLVYLQLPLNKIRVRTAREMKTAEVVRVFEKHIRQLQRETQQAIEAMKRGEKDFADVELWRETFGSLNEISRCLRECAQGELKIAVAATKKTGKSVIVNSMIEQELAPTSQELPTPNNCVYTRREDQYTLQSEGRELEGFGAGREGAARLNARLTREFERAQKSKAITIPDMHIGYMLDKAGITSYVITDTPGPDREGHLNAEEIARKAVRGADMAIYAIDYAKHLTKEEHKYLEWIVDEFEKNGKYYSLIFDVNKMDSRYQDKGHKSIPRSLDYIRQELIKIDPRFRSCILFGTSALTYFNALTAPQIPGCEVLEDTPGQRTLSEVLEELLEKLDDSGDSAFDNDFGRGYDRNAPGGFAPDNETLARDDSDPKTILNFLSEITTRLRRFHGVEARSLEDLKDFSGMKSLLSYVGYVAREKARMEKLYGLMRKIDYEYAKITNRFHFEELAEALTRNRDKVEEVRAHLERFAEEIGNIFDGDFPEVLQLCRAGEIKSDWIGKYGQQCPFRWAEVRDCVIRDLENSVNIDIRLKDLADNEMPAYLRVHYMNEQDKAGFGRTKKIGGQDRVLLDATKIRECYDKAAEQSTAHLPIIIEEKFKEANDSLKSDYRRAEKDLEGIFQTRQEKLKERVSYYSRLMWEDYSIPFDMETPAFTFELVGESIEFDGRNIKISRKALETMRNVMENSLKNAPLRGKSVNFFSQLLDIIKLRGREESDIPPMYYDADEFVRKYRNEISPHFVADLKTQHIEKQYQDVLDAALKVRRDYFDAIGAQMREEERRTAHYVQYVQRALDITGELDRKNKEIEKERMDLERVQNIISGFQNWWSKIRPDS